MSQGHCSQMDDDACGKLWEIYIAEAQRYDEGLVKSWKEDMDVTLVFSGLYSAVLTGFVLESYKNLQQDYAQSSAAALQTISSQLAAVLAGSDLTPRLPLRNSGDFTPSAPAVACNLLWFLSLTLALSCAFLATFVQQWTRHFLHRTTILRSSTACARLFSFLYFGLKEFRMHTIVDVIPSLLHLSLLSFFSGLVAFLWPVNIVLTWLVTGALVLITTVYLTFTILPVVRLNSPYQTPMSPVVWAVWKYIHATSHRILNAIKPRSSTKFVDAEIQLPPSVTVKPANHLTDAVILASFKNNRVVRESISLAWALRSLNEDTELLPFVEALLDAICSSDGPRTSHFHLIRPLLETTDLQIDIITRTMSLLSNASNPWFTDKHRARCRTACPKLIWCLAFILIQHPHEFSLLRTSRALWFSEKVVTQLVSSSDVDDHYSTSAVVLCRLNAAVCAETLFKQFIRENPSQEALLLLTRARTLFGGPLLSMTAMHRSLGSSGSLQEDVSLAPQHARALLEDIRFYRRYLLFQYLSNSAEALPYRFGLTVSMFDHDRKDRDRPFEAPFTFFRSHAKRLESCTTKETQKIISLNTVFGSALDFCERVDIHCVSSYVGRHITLHGWGSTIEIWTAQPHGFCAFYRGLSENLDVLRQNRNCIYAAREVIFCLGGRHQNGDVDPCWRNVLSTLQAIAASDLSSPQRSLVFMIKFMMLDRALGKSSLSPEEIQYLQRSICPQGQTTGTNGEIQCLQRSISPQGQTTGTNVKGTTIFEEIIPRIFNELLQSYTLNPFFSDALSTLLYIRCLNMVDWLASRLDATPEITYRLACETERLSRMCESELSTTLVDILGIVWTLWIEWNYTFDRMVWISMPRIADILRVLIKAAGIISAARDEVKRVMDSDKSAETTTQWGLKANCDYDLVGDVEDLKRILVGRIPYFAQLPPLDGDGL